MRRCLTAWVAVALLTAAWLSGCIGGPPGAAPANEPTASPATAKTEEALETPREPPTPMPEKATNTPTPTPTPTPVREEAVMTPEPTQGTPEARLPAGARQVVQMAKEDLARRLDLAPDDILVVSVDAVEWSDASLGCPQPGMMYAQVITPGFLIVLEAAGQTYEYHSGDDHILLCEKTTRGHSRPVPAVVDGHPWMPVDGEIEPTWPRRR